MMLWIIDLVAPYPPHTVTGLCESVHCTLLTKTQCEVEHWRVRYGGLGNCRLVTDS
jgi:hypothetical protein